MKKLLLLAHDYPPYNSVGALRPASWASFLSKNNFHVTVVSRNWSQIDLNDEHFYIRENKSLKIEKNKNLTIVSTPFIPSLSNKILIKYGKRRYKLIRKLITAIHTILEFYFIIGPKTSIYTNSRKILAQNKFDLIIATGEPFAMFFYASKLSNEYKIPWAADYRDLWTEWRYNYNPIIRYIMQLRERKILKTTSLIITVSENLKTIIERKCKKEIIIVSNGYDECEFISQKQNKFELTISLAGTIYKWHPIHSFLKTICELKTDEIRVNFYGLNNEIKLKETIQNEFPSIKDQVIFHKRLPVPELLEELSKSHFLLMFNDYPILGTKIFTYLKTRRNILFCYTNDKGSNNLKNIFFPNKTLLSLSNNLQEQLLLDLEYGICIKDEQLLFDILKQNINYFKTHNKVIDYTSQKDISHLSRLKQNLILKNKLLSLNKIT